MTAAPQLVYLNFGYASTPENYGPIAFISALVAASNAAPISEVAGSKIIFVNNDIGVPHTASGLGTAAFPDSFDNTSGTTATASTIDGGLTWSTGGIAAGGMSGVFTLGPPGTYYFGCAYHYRSAMRNVIISK